MELKTKYQYTYFIYPYLIEEKNYQKYLYKLLKNEQCRLKLFDNKKRYSNRFILFTRNKKQNVLVIKSRTRWLKEL